MPTSRTCHGMSGLPRRRRSKKVSRVSCNGIGSFTKNEGRDGRSGTSYAEDISGGTQLCPCPLESCKLGRRGLKQYRLRPCSSGARARAAASCVPPPPMIGRRNSRPAIRNGRCGAYDLSDARASRARYGAALAVHPFHPRLYESGFFDLALSCSFNIPVTNVNLDHLLN